MCQCKDSYNFRDLFEMWLFFYGWKRVFSAQLFFHEMQACPFVARSDISFFKTALFGGCSDNVDIRPVEPAEKHIGAADNGIGIERDIGCDDVAVDIGHEQVGFEIEIPES